jgi:hypothetical protein
MKQIIYIPVICILWSMLLGGTCAASICDNKETVIFFGNGIKTSEKNAYDSRNTLKRRFLQKILNCWISKFRIIRPAVPCVTCLNQASRA